MVINDIWFEKGYLYGRDGEGKEHRQSLLWYPKLRNATDEERSQYTLSSVGIHWQGLDEDVSFESFEYPDADPSDFQRFFLTHKEINIAEFANKAELNASLLRNYINGFKKPSEERKAEILRQIHLLGAELSSISF
ncbi:MAG: DUF2442 domain-containing protein [Bacteroidales bacterium]|nr:DUF2442 domain-containing protein [Bacteroidales bacterium]